MKFNNIDVNTINFDDGKKRVLILGNGISRLDYMEFVQGWQAEIWGCNSIFRELENGLLHRLDLMAGDKVTLKEAVQFRKEHDYHFRIMARSMATFGLDGTERIDIPDEYIYDSGTTLVCKALLNGYSEIYLIGFDLGGPDIYVPDHETRNKSSWIFRWRIIDKDFGLERITFIGRDHKEFISSNKPINTYAKVYMNGSDHLTKELEEVPVISNNVLILGNGKSRIQYADMIRKWKKELWVCNEAYQESLKIGVTRVNSVHDEMIREAYDFKVNKGLTYALFCSKVVPEVQQADDRFALFKEKRGWSTGALCVAQAIHENFDSILLAGFDFGGPDLYKDYDITGTNFVKQFIEIRRMYPIFKKKVKFLGKQPDFL